MPSTACGDVPGAGQGGALMLELTCNAIEMSCKCCRLRQQVKWLRSCGAELTLEVGQLLRHECTGC